MSEIVWQVDAEALEGLLSDLDEFEAKQIAKYPESDATVLLREGIRDGLKLAARAVETARLR